MRNFGVLELINLSDGFPLIIKTTSYGRQRKLKATLQFAFNYQGDVLLQLSAWYRIIVNLKNG